MDESTATEMSTPSVVNESTDQDTANASAAQPAAQETTVKVPLLSLLCTKCLYISAQY